jgi:hypothetical protein
VGQGLVSKKQHLVLGHGLVQLVPLTVAEGGPQIDTPDLSADS